MGRHSSPHRSATPKAALIGLPLATVVGLGSLFAINHHSGGGGDTATAASAVSSAPALKGCTTSTPLRVTTTEDFAPVLRTVTDRLEANGKDCVDYTITTESSAVTASGLMSGANDRTQVWIPDSSVWVQRVTAANPDLKLELGQPVATSPVLFTIPHAAVGRVRQAPLPWSHLIRQQVLPLRVATPERSTASLVSLLGVQKALAVSAANDATALQKLLLVLSRTTIDERELRRLATSSDPGAMTFPASEQQIVAMNAAHPDAKVGAITPAEGVPQFDYPVVPVAGAKSAPAKAVEALRAGLTSQEGVADLTKAGFRVNGSPGPGVEGVPASLPPTMPAGNARDTDTALKMWVTMSRQTRMLTVMDTSESMKKPALPTMNRIDLARNAAVQSLAKFPDSSQIGLWSFDMGADGQPDWKVLAPTRQLDEKVGAVTQRAALGQALQTLNWRRANGTALFDTIWGGYQEMQKTYQPDYTNTLLLITDGKNDDPDSITEDQLIGNLRKAGADSSRPVRLVLVAVSADADFATLDRIARAVPDGKAYDARKVESFFSIMQEALASRMIASK
ncbi:substrate-binding domain-containing protein [Arsenicicoccus dermatophilus]|uniref:substrate-binding domain-containing protein n=1 Tax=Arsenicicoccus dermatophilus TaxID=1076331 RepID=UPI00391702B9